MKKQTFNVIIENNGKFEPYDIMPYLRNSYKYYKKNPWKGEVTKDSKFDVVKKWIDDELKYQYWARCEYEMILVPWPTGTNETGKKIDIYEQCKMNLDLITELFIKELK